MFTGIDRREFYPGLTLVYFAVAQLPIYLSSLMLKPLAGAVAKTVTTGQATN